MAGESYQACRARGPSAPRQARTHWGYTYHAGHRTVYVSGTTPLALRSAVEKGRPEYESWLVDELPPSSAKSTSPIAAASQLLA